jgi:hypothetical protein
VIPPAALSRIINTIIKELSEPLIDAEESVMTQPAVCRWEVMGWNGNKTRAFFAQFFDRDIRKREGFDYGMLQSGG